jgi:hypothetical protein
MIRGRKTSCYKALTGAWIAMEVVLAPDAEIAMRMLDPDGARRVRAWFSYLERWDTDEIVRRNSEPLPEMPGVYMMRTTTDLRIFFQADGDTVTVLDIAKKAAILTTRGTGGTRHEHPL